MSAGKGDARRPESDPDAYGRGYEKIWGKKDELVIKDEQGNEVSLRDKSQNKQICKNPLDIPFNKERTL
jgi:hypothetical protein